MSYQTKLRHGAPAWFAMVGELMCEAALSHGLPPDLTMSVVERYSDGEDISPGLIQGLRFDIAGGEPSFRIGAAPDEQGDVTIEITAAAARALNLLTSSDPAYAATIIAFRNSGAMRIQGDLSPLGSWLATVHDRIVARTI